MASLKGSKTEHNLLAAFAGESQAISQWKKIVQSAGDVYPETLKFGVHRVGFHWHWKEELAKLEEGLEKLRKLHQEGYRSVWQQGQTQTGSKSGRRDA